VIYPDTSFIVSLFAERERLHTTSDEFYSARLNEVWVSWPWSLFETRNTLRKLDRPEAERLIAEIRREHEAGPFQMEVPSWDKVMEACEEVSIRFSGRIQCKSADMLHVGFALLILPDLFVPLDARQARLARAAGLDVVLIESEDPPTQPVAA